MPRLYLLFLLALASPSFADSSTDADVTKIQALDETGRDAVANADIPKYVSVLDPEVRMIPPGR